MASINPYIHFNGNAEEVFHFYQSVFGGEFNQLMRFKDLKGGEFTIPKEEENKIMHISLPIGNHSFIMGSDTVEMMGKVNEKDNRNAIAITAESREEADKLFNGLSANGFVEVPLSESAWGSYFAMFTDKYGVEWLLDCRK